MSWLGKGAHAEPTAEPEILSPTPKTHVVERDNRPSKLPSVNYRVPQVLYSMHVPTRKIKWALFVFVFLKTEFLSVGLAALGLPL